MSFSSSVKDELSRVGNQPECCAHAEMAVILCFNSPLGECADGWGSGGIATENAALARRVYTLLSALTGEPPNVMTRKKRIQKKNMLYVVSPDAGQGLKGVISAAGGGLQGANTVRGLTRKVCCRKAALRGAFLMGGFATDPEKTYHIEIYCKNQELAVFIRELLEYFNTQPKIIERAEYHIVYLKDGEGIVNFLNASGAHNALMSFENTRILKEMRSSVNRVVNCETANLEKTVNASLRQISSICRIRDTIGFDSLPDGLREIAEIRVRNPEMGLDELGKLIVPPLGKSGVNHRLRKLDRIAEGIK